MGVFSVINGREVYHIDKKTRYKESAVNKCLSVGNEHQRNCVLNCFGVICFKALK